MKLPRFDADGDLPPGIHWTDWETFELRFGRNRWRRTLLDGLKAAIIDLRKAGCQTVYVDGSFVTSKEPPGDFDGCWDPSGVDTTLLNPVLLDVTPPRKAQKARYGGELFNMHDIAIVIGGQSLTYIDFFQQDRFGKPKGIVGLEIRRLKL